VDEARSEGAAQLAMHQVRGSSAEHEPEKRRRLEEMLRTPAVVVLKDIGGVANTDFFCMNHCLLPALSTLSALALCPFGLLANSKAKSSPVYDFLEKPRM